MGNSRLESSGQRQQSFRIRGAKPNLSVPGKTSKKMTSASGYWFKFPDPSYRIHSIDLHVEKCDRNVFEFQYCMGRSMQFSQDKNYPPVDPQTVVHIYCSACVHVCGFSSSWCWQCLVNRRWEQHESQETFFHLVAIWGLCWCNNWDNNKT